MMKCQGSLLDKLAEIGPKFLLSWQALVRRNDPEVIEMLPRSVDIVVGDVGDPATVKAAVSGCSKIIYCATARSTISLLQVT
jgi:hypothetical protein